MFVIGNAETGENKVPAYLHSMVYVSHCKQITMGPAENVLHVAFALGCSVTTHVHAIQSATCCAMAKLKCYK